MLYPELRAEMRSVLYCRQSEILNEVSRFELLQHRCQPSLINVDENRITDEDHVKYTTPL